MAKRRAKQAPNTKTTRITRQTKPSQEAEMVCDLKRKRPHELVEITLPPKKQAKLDDDLEGMDEMEEMEGDGIQVVNDMKALEADLKKSYVKEYAKWKAEQAKQNPAPKLPKRATWKCSGVKPLNDMNKLPKGWTWDEPDLDKGDIDAQIKRCEERIAEQIMPNYFEHRLKGYQAAQKIRDDMAAAETGSYSEDVLERISTLKIIEKSLETEEDRFKQLTNVKALLHAYRTHKLDWYGGLVTYWSHGKQLCEPRPHHWAEVEAINRKHAGYESFWVEGNDRPGPHHQGASLKLPPHKDFHYYHAGVRLTNVEGAFAIQPPGLPFGAQAPVVKTPALVGATEPSVPPTIPPLAVHPWWANLEFIYDTGCDMMTLYQDDIGLLVGPWGSGLVLYPATTGCTVVATLGPFAVRDIIMVQVCLLDNQRTPEDPDGKRITGWIRTSASIIKTNSIPGGIPRLDDQWLRRTVYHASQPEASQLVRFSTTKNGLELTARQPVQPSLFALGFWPPTASWIGPANTPVGVPNIKKPPPAADRHAR